MIVVQPGRLLLRVPDRLRVPGRLRASAAGYGRPPRPWLMDVNQVFKEQHLTHIHDGLGRNDRRSWGGCGECDY